MRHTIFILSSPKKQREGVGGVGGGRVHCQTFSPAGPNSQAQTGAGEKYCPCSADNRQDWQSYPIDRSSVTVCDDHTYINTYIHTYIELVYMLVVRKIFFHRPRSRLRNWFREARSAVPSASA